jgi:SPP1 gp7 family putative phage head morphogenesis protein
VEAAWEAVEKGILAKQDALIKRIDEARAAGEEVGVSWLIMEERYDALLSQIRGGALAGDAAPAVAEAQRDLVRVAAEHAEKLTYLSVGAATVKAAAVAGVVWNRLPVEALETLVGFAGDGSPLATLFEDVAKERADAVRDTLIAGVGRGASAREIATELETVADVSRARALTIARTETHRAYRQASLDSYAQNPGIIDGWTWVCVCDRRSCAGCWAMHGTVHPLTQKFFGTHPSCRCSAAPHLRDLRTDPATQPDVRPVILTGVQKFAALPEADQKKILGPTLHEKYQAGGITLADAVHARQDPRWGTTRTRATIAQAEANAAARSR